MKLAITLMIAALALSALAAEEPDLANGSTGSHIGGPSSVPGQVRSDREEKLPLFKDLFDLQAYDGFRESLQRDMGITYGLDYNMLYQYADPSAAESSAAGGVFRLYGSWAPAGLSASHPGSLVIKLEHRHRLGTDIAPQQLAGEVGYA
jgi:porin